MMTIRRINFRTLVEMNIVPVWKSSFGCCPRNRVAKKMWERRRKPALIGDSATRGVGFAVRIAAGSPAGRSSVYQRGRIACAAISGVEAFSRALLLRRLPPIGRYDADVN
jgi:hypothetical protein